MNIFKDDMIEISTYYNKNLNKSIYSYLLSITENDLNRFNDYYTILTNKKISDIDVYVNNDGIQSYIYNPEINIKPQKLNDTSIYDILNIQNKDPIRVIQIFDNNMYKSIINNKLLELIYKYLNFIKYNMTSYYNTDKFKDIFLFINIKKQNDLIQSLQSQLKSLESNYNSIKYDIDTYINHINSINLQMNMMKLRIDSIDSQIITNKGLIFDFIKLQINNIYLILFICICIHNLFYLL